MTLRQIRTIRQRCADGTMFPAALDDLRFYLARYRYWNHKALKYGRTG